MKNNMLDEMLDMLGLKEKCVYARLENGRRMLLEKLNGGVR